MEIKEFIANTKAQFESDLEKIIAIPSVATDADGIYPYGKESARALDAMLELAEGYGFKTENHEYHCGSVLYGESEREVGIIAHLDVVPAGDGWSTESPFKLEKRGNCYIGRGTNDDKGPALMGLYVLRYFKENNIKLPFTLRLILGCDEEVGSSDLEYFKTVRKAPWFSFTPDSEFPVCIGEKGIMGFTVSLGKADGEILSLSAGTVSNAVPAAATVVLKGEKALSSTDRIQVSYENGNTTVKATGVTAHAAHPDHGVNAVGLLASYLIDNNAVPASNKNAFDFLNKSENEFLGNTVGIDFEDEYFGHLTCVGGLLFVKDGNICINFNVRFPMSKTFDQVFDKVEETVSSLGFELIGSNKGSSHAIGYFKSPDSPEIKALMSAYQMVAGDNTPPYTMGGGTYARGIENAVAFGVGQARYSGLLGEGKGSAHDVDEYIAEEAVEEGIEVFIRSIYGLSEI